ncbi:hypothetical protein IL306_007815 [Fusarium sp. DS 682]|nr:hypothetical protein IL306_007815 [Fusarium sp. DS 682]
MVQDATSGSNANSREETNATYVLPPPNHQPSASLGNGSGGLGGPDILKFTKTDQEEDANIVEARLAWEESVARLDAALAESPHSGKLTLQAASLQGAMTKADAVKTNHTSSSVFGQVIVAVLQEQKAKDSKLSGKMGKIMSKLYPAVKISLQLVAFGADAASFAPLKITANGLAQVVSMAMDEDVRRSDIIDELGNLSDHQQYVDSLRGLDLATLKPHIIVRALSLLTETNNYLRISMDYLASCYIKQSMTGTILDDKVTASKTALRDAIRDFNEAIGMEAYFIIWQEEDRRRRSKALDELTKVRYKRIHSEYRERRTLKTGQWLLSHPKFVGWVNGTQRCLWCPGIAGAGKTFLTSIVVDHINTFSQEQKPDVLPVGLAYAYCEYANQREQSMVSLLCSMTRQLIESETQLINLLQDFHARTADMAIGVAECTGLLRSLFPFFSKVFLVVDALDEFSSVDQERQNLATHLRDLALSRASNCSVLITSRPSNDIEELFDETSKVVLVPAIEDIASYVDMRTSQSYDSSSWVKGDKSLQLRIQTAVIGKSRGMFLLARLQMDQLLAQESVGELEDALETLTDNLDSYYDKAMARIRKLPEANHAKSTLDLLSWVCHTKRPMTICEIQHALAATHSEAGSLERLRRYFKDVNRILGRCAGLVLVREPDIVVPSHETVQQYLQSRTRVLFPNAEVAIPRSCLRYLLLDDLQAGPSLSDNDFDIRAKRLPFLSYSSLFWANYLQYTGEAELLRQAVQFLKNDGSRESVIQVLHAHRTGGRESLQQYLKGLTALHLASANDLVEVAKLLLEDKQDLSAQSGDGETPLHLAAAAGFQEMVALLLDSGADVNIVGGDYGTALAAASMNRHEDVKKTLLQHGATMDVSIGRFFDRFRDSPTWLLKRLSEADYQRRQRLECWANNRFMIQEPETRASETKRINFGGSAFKWWEVGFDWATAEFEPVPRLRAKDMAEPFECPCCFQIVTIESTAAWKKHVLRDLAPYICTFKHCTSQGYHTLPDWVEHESSHWVTWQCGHCDLVLDDATEWAEHVECQHAPQLAEARRQSGQAHIQVEMPDAECPFCEWKVEGPDDHHSSEPAATRRNWLSASRPVLKVQTTPRRSSKK